jgi:methionyl aminopeptidase
MVINLSPITICPMPKNQSGQLIPGKIAALQAVPAEIIRPEYVGKPTPRPHVGGDRYDTETIAQIRKASKIAAQALEVVLSSAKAGMTTDDLDLIGHEFLVKQSAYLGQRSNLPRNPR